MLSYNQALKLLKENNCSYSVIKHCVMVSEKSAEIAEKIKKKGFKVDVLLCQVGGLLHDIGRSKTQDIFHGVWGAKLLKDHPLLADIAKRHIGGGIDEKEAKVLGLPVEDYSPRTIEEKIVCYADKLVQGERFADDASEEIKKLENKLGRNHPAISRLRRIEDEIKKFIK